MSETGADVQRLLRWQQFGGVWRVASRDGSTVTLSLCRCDDGEEVDRLTSDDPELLGWLAEQATSTDSNLRSS